VEPGAVQGLWPNPLPADAGPFSLSGRHSPLTTWLICGRPGLPPLRMGAACPLTT